MTQGARLLREWLQRRGRTARGFAESLDVDEATVSRWLSGKLVPSTMAKIAICYLTDNTVPTNSNWQDPEK